MAEEAGFDAMITTDKGIRYQQNLARRRLALVVISTNDWSWLSPIVATAPVSSGRIASTR